MTQFLEPIQDGLPIRNGGNWTKSKLDYLNRYIGIFTNAMSDKFRSINYIDLFSGPGKIEISPHTGNKEVVLGSPLLALTHRKGFDKYYFVDNDPDVLSALETRCKSSPKFQKIQFYCCDSNFAVDSIVDEIGIKNKIFIKDVNSCLNLALIDPEGFEVNWNTISKLSSLFGMDLIIYFPEMGINRFLEKSKEDGNTDRIDNFFGSDIWQTLKSKRNVVYLNHYISNLKSLGYKFVGTRLPQMKNTKNAPLYRLIFASQHPKGKEFWDKITARDVTGQRTLF